MADEACGAAAPRRIRVGTSGWRYPPWRGVFYPAGLPRHVLEVRHASFQAIGLAHRLGREL